MEAIPRPGRASGLTRRAILVHLLGDLTRRQGLGSSASKAPIPLPKPIRFAMFRIRPALGGERQLRLWTRPAVLDDDDSLPPGLLDLKSGSGHDLDQACRRTKRPS